MPISPEDNDSEVPEKFPLSSHKVHIKFPKIYSERNQEIPEHRFVQGANVVILLNVYAEKFGVLLKLLTFRQQKG
jgi:hypothetical protein